MKRAGATKRMMVSGTRVVCNKEGDGNGCKSNGNEDDGQVTVTRAMKMATAKATTWVRMMATRLAGKEEGKGEGGKGDGDGDKGGGGQRGQGWPGDGNRDKGDRQATVTATKTKRVMVTATRVAGK
jgi:hypothetical protein